MWRKEEKKRKKNVRLERQQLSIENKLSCGERRLLLLAAAAAAAAAVIASAVATLLLWAFVRSKQKLSFYSTDSVLYATALLEKFTLYRWATKHTHTGHTQQHNGTFTWIRVGHEQQFIGQSYFEYNIFVFLFSFWLFSVVAPFSCEHRSPLIVVCCVALRWVGAGAARWPHFIVLYIYTRSLVHVAAAVDAVAITRQPRNILTFRRYILPMPMPSINIKKKRFSSEKGVTTIIIIIIRWADHAERERCYFNYFIIIDSRVCVCVCDSFQFRIEYHHASSGRLFQHFIIIGKRSARRGKCKNKNVCVPFLRDNCARRRTACGNSQQFHVFILDG